MKEKYIFQEGAGGYNQIPKLSSYGNYMEAIIVKIQSVEIYKERLKGNVMINAKGQGYLLDLNQRYQQYVLEAEEVERLIVLPSAPQEARLFARALPSL